MACGASLLVLDHAWDLAPGLDPSLELDIPSQLSHTTIMLRLASQY